MKKLTLVFVLVSAALLPVSGTHAARPKFEDSMELFYYIVHNQRDRDDAFYIVGRMQGLLQGFMIGAGCFIPNSSSDMESIMTLAKNKWPRYPWMKAMLKAGIAWSQKGERPCTGAID